MKEDVKFVEGSQNGRDGVVVVAAKGQNHFLPLRVDNKVDGSEVGLVKKTRGWKRVQLEYENPPNRTRVY